VPRDALNDLHWDRALQQSLPLSPTMSKLRAAIWSLAIACWRFALAALLSAWCRCRCTAGPAARVCCGAVSLGAALIAEISVRVGAEAAPSRPRW